MSGGECDVTVSVCAADLCEWSQVLRNEDFGELWDPAREIDAAKALRFFVDNFHIFNPLVPLNGHLDVSNLMH